jgi:hypothetical protein
MAHSVQPLMIVPVIESARFAENPDVVEVAYKTSEEALAALASLREACQDENRSNLSEPGAISPPISAGLMETGALLIVPVVDGKKIETNVEIADVAFATRGAASHILRMLARSLGGEVRLSGTRPTYILPLPQDDF